MAHLERLGKKVCVKLYRYFNATYGLQVLQSAALKVGRMLELNDPLDCQPMIVAPPEYDDERHEAYTRKFLSVIHEEFGLVCYSAVIEDPVIWSHYADAHRGMALEFEFDDDDAPRMVSYRSDRLRLDPNDPEIQGDTMWAITIGFAGKAKSWAYEREYRDFVELSACRMIGMHYFCEPRGSLRRIILGTRCPLACADVRRALSDQWPSAIRDRVSVWKARASRESFQIGAQACM